MRLCYVIKRIFYERFEYIIFAYILSTLVSLSPAKSGVIIKQIKTGEEIDSLKVVAGLSSFVANPINWLHKVFDDGGIGFIAWQNDQPVGCCWVSPNINPALMRIQVPLHRGDAYIHTLFVSSKHRGQGIGLVLASHRLQFLRKQGYERAIAAVLKGNIAPLRINTKLGYIQVGKLAYSRILFWDSNRYEKV